MTVTPDFILTCSFDKSIKILNTSDLSSAFSILNAHEHYIYCMAISKKIDYLASGSKDKNIKIWLFNSWNLYKTLIGHTDIVTCLDFG